MMNKRKLPRVSKPKRIVLIVILCLVAAYSLAMIPSSPPDILTQADNPPFGWNQSNYWKSLELAFNQARKLGCPALRSAIRAESAAAHSVLEQIAAGKPGVDDPIWYSLEKKICELAPKVAVCPDTVPEFKRVVAQTRKIVKQRSRGFDMSTSRAKSRVYRLLYGSRAALEEVLIQHGLGGQTGLQDGSSMRLKTPHAQVLGVTVHSGDLLLSRGNAPTSALIARGSDYPGNFSHVALVHVDEQGKVSIIEAHIEQGVAVASVDKYLADKKLRIMLLRLRDDLQAVVADPMLPHKAATRALERTQKEHIPYDFAMDLSDGGKLFCSEVASSAYKQEGISLFLALSSISNPFLKLWLREFGVQHFKTQGPSDLEYDPQLVVVKEWRDPSALAKDRLDNAVIDARIAEATKGKGLDYNPFLLPVVRAAKLYSLLLNATGRAGPIPEGMGAQAAIINQRFTTDHKKIAQETARLAEDFQKARGYVPPYWELVEMARSVVRSY
jgi:hypothetical protein